MQKFAFPRENGPIFMTVPCQIFVILREFLLNSNCGKARRCISTLNFFRFDEFIQKSAS